MSIGNGHVVELSCPWTQPWPRRRRRSTPLFKNNTATLFFRQDCAPACCTLGNFDKRQAQGRKEEGSNTSQKDCIPIQQCWQTQWQCISWPPLPRWNRIIWTNYMGVVLQGVGLQLAKLWLKSVVQSGNNQIIMMTSRTIARTSNCFCTIINAKKWGPVKEKRAPRSVIFCFLGCLSFIKQKQMVYLIHLISQK